MQALYYLTAIAVAILCIIAIRFAIVRLSLVHGHLKDRIKYTIVLVLALIAGAQPYYAQYYPNAGLLALAVCLVIVMVDGVPSFHKYKNKTEHWDTEIFDQEKHGGDEW